MISLNPTQVVRDHRALIAVLAVAALARALVAAAYWPALTFSDSWAYLNLAYSRFPTAFHDDRPSGYPLLLRAILSPFRDLASVTLLQHLAGLVSAALVYFMLLRLDVRKFLAVGACALVALDSFVIGVEQYVASEAFFILLVVAATWLVATRPASIRAVAASGILFGMALTVRSVGLFAVAVWLLYLLWSQRRAVTIAVAVVALAVPLLAYATARSDAGASFALTRDDGWLLYGRVSTIVDSCKGADVPTATRSLCKGAPNPPVWYEQPSWYMWATTSPAHQLFPGEGPSHAPRSNAQLRSFAVAIIAARPTTYARSVGRDALAYFDYSNSYENLELPRHPERLDAFSSAARDQYLPGYRPPHHSLMAVTSAYWRWMHIPRFLLGIFAVMGLVAAAAPAGANAVAARQRRAAFLVVGIGLAMLIGTAATYGFALRYLIPAVPFLVAAAALAAERAVTVRLRRVTAT